MKKSITILALLFQLLAVAQNENPVIASMMVTESAFNNEDDSKESIENRRHIIFSDIENQIILINSLIEVQTKSFGKIDKVKQIPTNDKTKMHYQMDWYYENSYDESKGIATIDLYINEIIHEDYTHWGEMIIKTDSEMLLNYKGPFFYYIKPLIFQYQLETKSK
jgi:hypothetical protein